MRNIEGNMFIELIEVNGFEGAMFGMRNPLNSWGLGDSQWVLEPDKRIPHFEIGEKDLDLAKRLIKNDNAKIITFQQFDSILHSDIISHVGFKL